MNRRHRRKGKEGIKITFIVFILTHFTAFLVSYFTALRVFLLICFSLLFLCLAVSFLIRHLPEKGKTIVRSVRNIVFYSHLLFMGVIFYPLYLYSVSKVFVFTLAGVFGVVIGIAYALWKRKMIKPWKLAGWSVLVALGGFVVLSVLLLHANYAFDFNEPTEYVVVIENKDVNLGTRRTRTTHTFTVTADGKTFDVHVPRSHYSHYEVGDTYYIYRYGGALGQPLYLSYAYVD